MMTNLNALKLNDEKTVICARATRSSNGYIKLGKVLIDFIPGVIKICISPNDREVNKQKVVDIERIIHSNRDILPTAANLEVLAADLYPITSSMLVVK